jgi:hypothetical protein
LCRINFVAKTRRSAKVHEESFLGLHDAVNDAQPTLDYSRSRPRSRWRRTIVISVLVIAAVILSPKVMRVGERWKRRSRFLSVQRQCMNLTYPVGQVAYEEDVRQALVLSGGQPTDAGVLHPALLTQYIDWDASGPVMNLLNEFVFLHARQAKGGTERLVHVGVNRLFALRFGIDGNLAPGKVYEQQVLDWQVIRPGTLFSPAASVASGSWGNSTININMPKPLRIYAGQIDPGDDSHFTIQAATPQGTLTIEGWLQANDQISFSVK